ncbi:MAG: gamma-glutamylcyclotransferase [Alphaproteobacteria bacterium]|nr:gamma-glutamylcyclotransferase [Alphaproteobacteria bacterium]
MNDLLFVYGTLRRTVGAPAHALFAEQATFFDDALLQGRLYDLGNYPGAVLSDRLVEKVQGEIYRLHTPKRTLDLLDEYEGIHGGTKAWPEAYARVTHGVTARHHGRINAWVYVYRLSVAGRPLVASGDYAEYLRGKPNYRLPAVHAHD